MLTFLYVAAKQGYVVDAYADEAVGVMTKNERGKMWVSQGDARARDHVRGREAARQPSNWTSCIISRTRNASSPIR